MKPMNKSQSLKLAKILRYTARTILLLIAVFWFVFAMLSGAEGYGGGIKGIIMNSPNALPWLVLLGLVYVAWRWEKNGGGLIIFMGLFTIFAFNAAKHTFVLFAISIPLILLGSMLIGSWYLRKKNH